jgi:hypothetical protein
LAVLVEPLLVVRRVLREQIVILGIDRSEIESAVRLSTTASPRPKNSSIVRADARSRERERVR